MIHLLPHQRVKIPNSLAVVAALLLVTSSIVGFESNTATDTNARPAQSQLDASNAGTDSINGAANKKVRKLNIGSLLFRKG
jgi:hypothetical protein